ncbi:uncharacterized protein LOC111867030 isoform X2 [Cryptotermes secundus]|nr:uncharacterized protein LOC111867030 isoform X2 [Cryptotermes secundus]
MRNSLTILSLCFVAAWILVKGQPLCNIETLIGNETSHVQAFFNLLDGDIQDLKCKAGCGLYIVNGTLGAIIHNFSGFAYQIFENCIKKGVRTGDACKITDCLMDLTDMGLKVAKSANLTIPLMDEIEWLIGIMKTVYTAENSANGIFIAHEQSEVLQFSHRKVSPSPTIEQLENEHKQVQKHSNSTSVATSLLPAIGILSASGYFTFLYLLINI